MRSGTELTTGGTSGSAGTATGGTGQGGTGQDGGAGAAGSDGGTPVGTGATQKKTIGASGGSISLEGLTLTIPPGALAQDANFMITSLPQPATSQNTDMITPIYSVTPHDIVFAQPVDIKFTLSAAPPAGTQLYWTLLNQIVMEPLSVTLNGNEVTAKTTHFSCGGVFTPCKSEPCQASAPAICLPM